MLLEISKHNLNSQRISYWRFLKKIDQNKNMWNQILGIYWLKKEFVTRNFEYNLFREKRERI